METAIRVPHQQSDGIINLIIFFSRADCKSPTTTKNSIDINAGTLKKIAYFLISLTWSLFLAWYPEEKFILLSSFQYKPVSMHNKYETAFITLKLPKLYSASCKMKSGGETSCVKRLILWNFIHTCHMWKSEETS